MSISTAGSKHASMLRPLRVAAWEEWALHMHMEERGRVQVEYVTITEEDAAAIAAVNPNHEGPPRKNCKMGKNGGKKRGRDKRGGEEEEEAASQ